MIAEAGAAISGIKVAMEMAKGIAALNSEAEINQALIDIQRTLLEVQSAAFDDKLKISQLVDEKAALEKKLAEVDSWVEEKKRYCLTKSEVGTFTYELRADFAEGEAHHRLCVTCFGNGKKSILQRRGNASGAVSAFCQNCHAELDLSAGDSNWEFRPLNRP